MSLFLIPGGDLLETAKTHNLIHAFAHGANCWQTMGSGIAAIIKRDWFDLFWADGVDNRIPEERLGKFTRTYTGGITGYNLYTQFYPGPHARLEHIKSALEFMLEDIHEAVEATKDDTIVIGIPAIGCGIGGLDLTAVSILIADTLQEFNDDNGTKIHIVMYVLEKEKFNKEITHLFLHYAEKVEVMENEQEILDEIYPEGKGDMV